MRFNVDHTKHAFMRAWRQVPMVIWLAVCGLLAPHPARAEPVFSVSGNAGQNSDAGCASFGLPSPLTSTGSVSGQAKCL